MNKKEKAFKRRMEKRLSKVQGHHITYKPEWIVPVFLGEHWLLSQFQRRKYTSEGFLIALDYELKKLRKGKIYQLELPEKKKRKKKRRRRK